MLAGMALLIGEVAVMQASPRMGILYLALLIGGGALVLWAYCAKCPCRSEACGHVLPGLLTRLLPSRKPGPYTWYNFTLTGLLLLTLVSFPQPWLWQQPPLAWAFWGLLATAMVEILLFVCPRCANPYCPNCKSQKKV